MTPQFILKASLCREPHCASEPNWKDRAISEIESMDWAPAYAEPGYQPRLVETTDKKTFKGILFANWNYFPRDICDLLERAGYEIEWSDEWSTCSDCGRAIRHQADGYDWQPSYVLLNDCEEVCVDCLNGDAGDWLESLEDNPRRAVNVPSIDMAKWGYRKIEGQFESGWHPGQTDNPKAIFERLKDEHERIVFRIDEVSQFYTVFSVWEKVPEGEEVQSEAD